MNALRAGLVERFFPANLRSLCQKESWLSLVAYLCVESFESQSIAFLQIVKASTLVVKAVISKSSKQSP